MRVHLHTLCWNDRPMLDYFFRHYEQWVDRFFMLDDGSTDGTLEYLRQKPNVEIGRVTRSDPASWVASAKAIYDNDWKRSRGEADWVVVTNIDEHLHHGDMRAYLSHLLEVGATVAPSLGYQMLSMEPPALWNLLWRDCPFGAPWRKMSKLGIFRPDKIEETNFSPGRHSADICGDVAYPERDEIVNLHFKYIWGLDSTHARHSAQSERLGPGDHERRWGQKYVWMRDELGAEFDRFRSGLIDTSRCDHHACHPEHRWWRKRGWRSVSAVTHLSTEI